MGQKGVDQRAGLAAGRRMGGHARRLVDDDQVGVFVEDGQGNGFRLGRGGRDGRQGDGVEAGLGLGRPGGQGHAVTADGAFGQQRLKPCARQGGKGRGQRLVQTDAGYLDPRLQHFSGCGVFVVGQIGFGQVFGQGGLQLRM